MFTYKDWCNPGKNFLDVMSISNRDLYNIVSEHQGESVHLVSDIGNAEIFYGVPIPTLDISLGFNSYEVEAIEDLLIGIHSVTGYVCSRVLGTSTPCQVSFNGSAFIVEAIGRLSRGFRDLYDALAYCKSIS